ncbi:Protoheme IX farnesyltransferase, partial [Fasciolopsis buskii]
NFALSTASFPGTEQLDLSFPTNLAVERARSSTVMEVVAGLSKARLSGLVVSTAVVGCALAAPTSLVTPEFLLHPYQTLICLAVGTGLTSAAANTINQGTKLTISPRTKNRLPARLFMFSGL